jgi:hypothetical protein
METINTGRANGLLPAVQFQALPAVALGVTVAQIALSAKRLDLTGSEERRNRLKLRFLARA